MPNPLLNVTDKRIHAVSPAARSYAIDASGLTNPAIDQHPRFRRKNALVTAEDDNPR